MTTRDTAGEIAQKHRVTDEAPRRLETFARHYLPSLSRQAIRRLIAAGAIRVNGRPAHKGDTLAVGDQVTLPRAMALRPQAELPVHAAYVDSHLLAVVKPGGMPSHARDPHQPDTVAAWLCAHYPDTTESGEPFGSGLAHRLDTGTSGLLLAARSPEVFVTLREAFRRRQIEKRYLAVVSGMVPDELTLTASLAHAPGDRQRMRLAQPGDRSWRAQTVVHRVARHADWSVLAITMRTGVTHQIRIHLAAAGHPIVGDTLYGGALHPALAPNRHALHASAIALAHPVTNAALSVEAAEPSDLRALLESIRLESV